tara:strand:- start:2059 stop:2694 length:636 start_codon:yes stop_codon:yes gene_type:complete
MIKLVIFDLDGVLVDACEWHRLALNRALKEVSDYEISLEDHVATFNGIPTRVKLAKLVELGTIEEGQVEEIYHLKQDLTVQLIEESAHERQEKIDLINWLKEKGVKVACYTNSIRKTADLMLEKTGVFSLLDRTITNQDVKESKPAPEGYVDLVKHYDLDPSEVAIVEDSPKGLQAAYASGCNVMEVPNADAVNKENVRSFINENFDTDGW